MADPAYPAALGRAILERTDPRFAPGSGPPVQKPSALGALGYLPPEARSAYMSLVRTIAGPDGTLIAVDKITYGKMGTLNYQNNEGQAY